MRQSIQATGQGAEARNRNLEFQPVPFRSNLMPLVWTVLEYDLRS